MSTLFAVGMNERAAEHLRLERRVRAAERAFAARHDHHNEIELIRAVAALEEFEEATNIGGAT